MSPGASEDGGLPGSAPARPGAGGGGFTLIEMVVALVVATLLITATYRFFKDVYGSFNLQEQLAERDQNANFVLNRFVELLQQAGSALPDSGWAVIRRVDGGLLIATNPLSAEHFNGVAAPSSHFVAIGDAGFFRDPDNPLQSATHVLIDFADPGQAIAKIAIDGAYDAGGFVAGIKDNASGQDSLRLVSPVALAMGDRIYGYREYLYLVSDGNLLLRPDGPDGVDLVLAENIDSLGFTFLDRDERPTWSWRDMQTATITVRARTSRPDPKLPAPGYRMSTATMNVHLRNRM